MERVLITLALVALVALAAYLLRRRERIGALRVDPSDFGLSGDGQKVVGFTSPYCLACGLWRDALHAREVDATFVEVGSRPDLVRKYNVDSTPLILLVDMPGGKVVDSWWGDPEPEHLERLTLTA